MWKKILVSILVLILVIAASIGWLMQSIKGDVKASAETLPTDINYIINGVNEHRGRILAVVTSVDKMGSTDKKTGYELTELARAYYVFQANGFEVDIASTSGGEPPVVIDADDMGAFDYAFLNDTHAQHKVKHSLNVNNLDPKNYDGVYFVGGKGAMFDFPDNQAIQQLIKTMYTQNKVVAAVCHGPAALVNVTLADGEYLIANKQVSAFTNSEELFLIKDAAQIFPFLLETKLQQRQANVVSAPDYLAMVSQDNNLITGQNPWSVWQLAEQVVLQLGYTPKTRSITAEEISINLIKRLHQSGLKEAVLLFTQYKEQQQQVNKELIAIHGLVALMKFDLMYAASLFRLLSHVNGTV